MSPTFASMSTPGGHTCGEVASALQKAIRRGEERQALYWASELDLAGYAPYVWKRLRIIASEDVGLAEPTMCVTVHALYESWLEQRKNDKTTGRNASRIFLVHAVIVLCRAKKSRMVDHAVMVVYYGKRKPLQIPDHAKDKHTAAGKRLGRGWKHFFEVAAKLNNVGDVDDVYEKEARGVWKSDTDTPAKRMAEIEAELRAAMRRSKR